MDTAIALFRISCFTHFEWFGISGNNKQLLDWWYVYIFNYKADISRVQCYRSWTDQKSIERVNDYIKVFPPTQPSVTWWPQHSYIAVSKPQSSSFWTSNSGQLVSILSQSCWLLFICSLLSVQSLWVYSVCPADVKGESVKVYNIKRPDENALQFNEENVYAPSKYLVECRVNGFERWLWSKHGRQILETCWILINHLFWLT